MGPVGTLALCIVAGFVFSNVIAATALLVMRQTGPLVLRPRNDLQRVLALGLVTFTGPAVLFENSMEGQRRGQPLLHLYVALTIVTLWSFLLGLFIVRLAQVLGLLPTF